MRRWRATSSRWPKRTTRRECSRHRGERGGCRQRPVLLAIVGRPNVGKSTLLKRLVGEERMLTAPRPASRAIRFASNGSGGAGRCAWSIPPACAGAAVSTPGSKRPRSPTRWMRSGWPTSWSWCSMPRHGRKAGPYHRRPGDRGRPRAGDRRQQDRPSGRRPGHREPRLAQARRPAGGIVSPRSRTCRSSVSRR